MLVKNYWTFILFWTNNFILLAKLNKMITTGLLIKRDLWMMGMQIGCEFLLLYISLSSYENNHPAFLNLIFNDFAAKKERRLQVTNLSTHSFIHSYVWWCKCFQKSHIYLFQNYVMRSRIGDETAKRQKYFLFFIFTS